MKTILTPARVAVAMARNNVAAWAVYRRTRLANSGTVDGRLIVSKPMAETNHFTSADPNARITGGAPHIAGTAAAFPPNRYNHDEVVRELTTFADPEFMRFARKTGVDQCSLTPPPPRRPMRSFQ